MNGHKIADLEVMTAFELCFAKKGTTYTCAKCPYHKFGTLCKVERDRDAIALFNRQKAEIERLNTLAKLGQMRANDYRAMRDKAKTARVEAIKSFAEKLKKEEWYFGRQAAVSTIDHLVKELTEEKE